MRKKITKIILTVVLVIFSGVSLSSCGLLTGDSVDYVEQNLTKDADNFLVVRKVVFYNSITDVIMFEMQGTLSITADTADNQLEVVVKLKEYDDDGKEQVYYQKHFLGLSDNVTYMIIQIGGVKASDCAFKLYFRPETIPGITIETLPKTQEN